MEDNVPVSEIVFFLLIGIVIGCILYNGGYLDEYVCLQKKEPETNKIEDNYMKKENKKKEYKELPWDVDVTDCEIIRNRDQDLYRQIYDKKEVMMI